VRHVRMLGLCLAAVLAVAAFAAASASAATPEWGQCFAKTGGKYTNSSCTTKGKGGTFEWRKGSEIAKKKFTGAGGIGVLRTIGGDCRDGNQLVNPGCEGKENHEEHFSQFVECENENAVGEAAGTHEVKGVKVDFHSCKLLGSLSCSNTETEGQVDTNELKGKLGFTDKAKDEAGVELTPVKKHGQFAKFECAGVVIITVGEGGHEKVKGHTEEPFYAKGGGDTVISPVTPVNTMSSSFTQVYKVNEETAENIPSKFEGGKLDLLEDFAAGTEETETNRWAYSPAGEEITNVNTPEEAVEIRA
jgi:hypothetical protein